jgi:putative transposase
MKAYRIMSRNDSRSLTEYLTENGQILLPMVELIEGSRMAIDELIDVLGRASIEAVLQLSARGVAGEKQRGRARGAVRWHGTQAGSVRLSDRKLRVRKPRLRKKGAGKDLEVEIPAYEAINANGKLGNRVLEILMSNVSTRRYERVIPQMADTVGVSKSSVSREFIEQSGKELKRLSERRFDEREFLVIYLDGVVFGEFHVLCAVGVDSGGEKVVLGMRDGASENGATAVALLEDLVERGIDPDRRYLFVIDGSKALRTAITRVFGRRNPVQRCRNHKIRNVTTKLPEDLASQVRLVMRAAFRLPAKDGIARLRKQADWLRSHHPDAASSLEEGLDELFTVNRLDLGPALRRCLGTTNIIDSSHSGMRIRTRRVGRWKNADMVLRWAAASFLDTEKHFRKILGYKDLWMLQAKLNDPVTGDQPSKVA